MKIELHTMIDRAQHFLHILSIVIFILNGHTYAYRSYNFMARSTQQLSQRTTANCPEEADLLPCKCIKRDLQLFVRCKNSEIWRINKALDLLRDLRSPIQELHLVSNKIMELPARFLGPLQVNSLFLINNEIVGISKNAFAGQEASLQNLYIDESLLQKLPTDTFDNLQTVQKIIFENSMISEIPNLSYLSQLEELRIFQSKLKEISVRSHKVMENVHRIQISNSPMKILPENLFEDFNYMEEVDLSSNKISWVHPRTFNRLERVRTLKLSANDFQDASTAVMAAREIRSLEFIDLSDNRIHHLRKGSFVDMQRLTDINLSGNGISQIDQEAFYRLPSLKRLDLSNNKLLFFDPDVFTGVQGLEILNLADNLLTYVVDVKFISMALPNLKSFDVSSNALTEENVFMFGGHPKLEILDISANKIKSLPKGFLRDLPSLKRVNLGKNQIAVDHTELIWDLPKLISLDISENKLKEIHPTFLEGLPSLQNFDVSLNEISNLDPRAFELTRDIRSLNMSFNRLNSIKKQTLSYLNDLTVLDISSNLLTTINDHLLEGATLLQKLHACCNQISTVHANAFRDNIELSSLDLSKNLFKKLPASSFTPLTTLRDLNLMGNGIVTIQNGDFARTRVIESLDLSKNHIQTIHKNAFSSMDLLKKLDLSSNYVQKLPHNTFSQMNLLEKLNISNNFITSLVDAHFARTDNLRVLDLTNNSLTRLDNTFAHLEMVKKLYVSHNYITSLGSKSFTNMKEVEEISFSHNGIQVLEPGAFQNMASLQRLAIENNNIVELSQNTFKNLSNLEEINLSTNQISLVKDNAFSNLPDLRMLSLQENSITQLPPKSFEGLLSLQMLNLSHNELQDVPQEALLQLPTLDVLDLSRNYFLEILNKAFDGLQWLTVLLLNDNDLCLLADNAFEGPKNLKVLMLQNNQLKSLHLDALRNPIQTLSLLDMSGNPFECDCQMVWLREYIAQEKQRRMARLQNLLTHYHPNQLSEPPPESLLSAFASPLRQEPVCAGPKKYEGMPITSVPPEAFLCSNINEIETGRSRCLPRYLNQLLEKAELNGTKFPPEVHRVLQSLKNQSQDHISSISRADLMNYLNPFFHQNLKSRPIVVNNGPMKKTAAVNVKPSGETGIGKDFVTGDTPTIYAGSSASTKTKQKVEKPKESGGLFGFQLPNLPNIFESFTNKLPNLGLNIKLGGLPFGRKDGPHHSQLVGEPNISNTPSWIEIAGSKTPSPKINSPRSNDSKTVSSQGSLSAWMNKYYTDNKELIDMSLLRPFSEVEPTAVPPAIEILGPGPEAGTPFLPALGDVQQLTTQKSETQVPSTRSSKVFSINDADLRGITPGHDAQQFQWNWGQNTKKQPHTVKTFPHPDPFIVVDNPRLHPHYFHNQENHISTTKPSSSPQDIIDLTTITLVPDSGDIKTIEPLLTIQPSISKSEVQGDTVNFKETIPTTENVSYINPESTEPSLLTNFPVDFEKSSLGNQSIHSSSQIETSQIKNIPENSEAVFNETLFINQISENISAADPEPENEENLLPPKKKYISPSRTVGRHFGVPKIQKLEIATISSSELPLQSTTPDNERQASALAHSNNKLLIENDDWYFKSYYQEYDPNGPIGGNGPPPNSMKSDATKLYFCNSLLILWLSLH